MPVLPPSPAALTLSGSIMASAPNMQSDHAEAGEAARRAGGRQHAVADGAGRADHLDRAEHAFVVRNAGRQHRAHAGVGRRLGVGERVVDRAFDLRVGAGPVDHHVVAGLADGDEQPDRLAVVDAVVVDPVLEAPFAVGQLAQRGARQALGVVDDLLQIELGPLRRRSARRSRRTASRRCGRRQAARAGRRTPAPAGARSSR